MPVRDRKFILPPTKLPFGLGEHGQPLANLLQTAAKAHFRGLDARLGTLLAGDASRYPFRPCLREKEAGGKTYASVELNCKHTKMYADPPKVFRLAEDGRRVRTSVDELKGATAVAKVSLNIMQYSMGAGGSKLVMRAHSFLIVPDEEDEGDGAEDETDSDDDFFGDAYEPPSSKRARDDSGGGGGGRGDAKRGRVA